MPTKIQRFTQKPYVFEFEGMRVGLRMPLTFEMEKIVKLRQPYFKSLFEAAKAENQSQLDLDCLIKLQYYISATLCCDPEDASNPWFAKDKEEQEQLAKSGVEKDCPEDVPYAFHTVAHDEFMKQIEKVVAQVDNEDPSEGSGKKKKKATQPEPTTLST
jgi:hypothetical protein